MNDEWLEIPSLEWSEPASNGDQAQSNGLSDRQILQREQDHFGWIVIGSPDDEDNKPGAIIRGIHIGVDRVQAPDIILRVIGPATKEEWREHVLFNFGPSYLAEFNAFVAIYRYIVRAVAE